MRYPGISEIETQWRASASRFCIIVEGETEQDDAWFYNQWFGERAMDVFFFPQNGWERVRNAVTELRQLLGEQFVFGIVDRDFSSLPSFETLPADGILQTKKYTLENYLLAPACWYKVVRPFTRRSPKSGWNSAEEVEATILGLYQECIALAAHNFTLRETSRLDMDAFTLLPTSMRRFKDHPKALSSLGNLPEYFRTIQHKIGINEELDMIYVEAYERYLQMDLSGLEQGISGKPVLKLLHEGFPMGALTKKAWSDTLGAYIDACPEPPDDLKTLIDLVVTSI